MTDRDAALFAAVLCLAFLAAYVAYRMAGLAVEIAVPVEPFTEGFR